MNDIAIKAHDLVKKFGDFTAVDHISFDVRREEIFGFLGPNGAGKTTTISLPSTITKRQAIQSRDEGAPVRFKTSSNDAMEL